MHLGSRADQRLRGWCTHTHSQSKKERRNYQKREITEETSVIAGRLHPVRCVRACSPTPHHPALSFSPVLFCKWLLALVKRATNVASPSASRSGCLHTLPPAPRPLEAHLQAQPASSPSRCLSDSWGCTAFCFSFSRVARCILTVSSRARLPTRAEVRSPNTRRGREVERDMFKHGHTAGKKSPRHRRGGAGRVVGFVSADKWPLPYSIGEKKESSVGRAWRVVDGSAASPQRITSYPSTHRRLPFVSLSRRARKPKMRGSTVHRRHLPSSLGTPSVTFRIPLPFAHLPWSDAFRSRCPYKDAGASS